jgi:23S rRNA (cytidine2498-2'-O)-methyltransferase
MPQLILTTDPDSVDLALGEARRAATEVTLVAELAPGVLLLDCVEGFWGLAESWRIEPPIFARHINPVDLSLPLRNSEDDIYMLIGAVEQEYGAILDRELTFSVQSRILTDLPYKPFALNRAISNHLQEETGARLDVRNPEQILSVVCATLDDRRQTPDDRSQAKTRQRQAQASKARPAIRNSQFAFIGLSLTTYNLSSWAGGEHRFAREEGQISRAEFKLLEALDVFGIELPSKGVALDLGAAPGGWTRILRNLDQYVTAVDPAELDPRLSQDKGVRHKRMTAEEYLANEPDEFDLIVNDMRMDARDSARLMVSYARQLYPHGIALMTFKLPEQGRRSVLDHAFRILREAYQITGARQLFHNRSEITLSMKKEL